ncbi:MAG: hypothetical protein MJZ12_08050 [Prevotella sp.]|nr:hypothetical protein [Prevotella sp.]
MKKCLILSLFTLLALVLGAGTGFSSANAQSRSNHINLGVGYMIENTMEATVGFEHETKYHNSWEYFISGSLKYEDCTDCGHICNESFWNNYNTIGGGVCYKPCVIRARNNHGNLRLGASGNIASTGSFVTGIHAAYEHTYALRSGWNIYWQVKCDGMINGKDNIRGGFAIGLKLPCGK